ncbi:hypothetical protein GALL_503450 [mine drainage metagenome]|uniref:Uncharacterized protein n=1 Tax=mine drainage metagenome TaxID=410659 RepID=A0A1J5PKH2_9ZZZZ
MIAALWSLAGLFLVLLVLIIATARASHEATDGGLGTGLVMLVLQGLALLLLASWSVALLIHLCVHP